MSDNEVFTYSERTVKKYTVYQAMESARRRIGDKKLCVNALKGRSPDEKITLQELNVLSDAMYRDTKYSS